MIPLVAPSYSPADRLLAQWDTDVQVRLFEEEFAEYVGCRGAVAVNSGTNALIVAMQAWGPPAMVGIQSYTCRATLDATEAVRPRIDHVPLVDNRCDVRNADFGAIGPVTLRTHMFGRDDGTGLFQDITLSLGAKFHSKSIMVCSFNRDKMISTGRGGMIAADSDDLLGRCRELAYYDQPLLSKPGEGNRTSRPIHATSSGSESNGYKPAFSFGMTGMQAALGRSQLKQLPGFIERRREIASMYTEAFSAAGIEAPDRDVDSVFFRYIVGVPDPAGKVAVLAERGIEAGRGVNPPLHRLLGLDNEQFPGAEECFGKLLSVPVHPGLTDDQVEFITRQVVEVCAP